MKKKIIPLPKKCVNCRKLFTRDPRKSIFDFKEKKFCTKNCYLTTIKREQHPNWKGGIKHRPDGYLRDSLTDKYIHRLVMEKHLGRELQTWEHVHHIDGNPQNNNIKNLQTLTNSEHRKLEYSIAKKDGYGKFSK